MNVQRLANMTHKLNETARQAEAVDKKACRLVIRFTNVEKLTDWKKKRHVGSQQIAKWVKELIVYAGVDENTADGIIDRVSDVQLIKSNRHILCTFGNVFDFDLVFARKWTLGNKKSKFGQHPLGIQKEETAEQKKQTKIATDTMNDAKTVGLVFKTNANGGIKYKKSTLTIDEAKLLVKNEKYAAQLTKDAEKVKISDQQSTSDTPVEEAMTEGDPNVQ